jgi:hypothetical protein
LKCARRENPLHATFISAPTIVTAASVVALIPFGPLNAVVAAVWPFGAFVALWSLGAFWPLGAFVALWSLGAFRSLGSLWSLASFRPFRPLTFYSLGSVGPLRRLSAMTRTI